MNTESKIKNLQDQINTAEIEYKIKKRQLRNEAKQLKRYEVTIDNLTIAMARLEKEFNNLSITSGKLAKKIKKEMDEIEGTINE